ncbi:hypothetical protein [Phenylobacterium sp.]|uniref:hypothetical protein n=1 Tax=Phenylobacterium sp. TaxID=1871053 RepID=UPI00272FE16B|nr:hypothetical protein [Phenylobacterium sp.]MDP1875668.1 hypothetical protein [Phenylobacterium sp.]
MSPPFFGNRRRRPKGRLIHPAFADLAELASVLAVVALGALALAAFKHFTGA